MAKTPRYIEIEIGGKEYKCKLAISKEEKEMGLMFESKLPKNEGVLFIYKKPLELCEFWMKNTYIPLDIVFINEDLEVVSVKEGKPESEKLVSEKNIQFVLEVNKDSGIEEDDEMVITNDPECIFADCGCNDSSDSKDKDGDSDEDDEDNELLSNVAKVLNKDGSTQMIIKGGERIFSRPNTRVLIKKSKKADKSKDDKDYKALGKMAFKYLKIQDDKGTQYLEK